MSKSLDKEGLFFEVNRLLMEETDGPRRKFCDYLVDKAVKELGIDEDENLVEIKRLKNEIFAEGIQLSKIKEIVRKKFSGLKIEGNIPRWIDKYKEKAEIKPERFTDPVRHEMTWFLLNRGVQLSDKDPENNTEYKKYEEHIADAYYYAVQRQEGRDDPIDAMRSRGEVDTWDFTCDTFEGLDDQEVLPENIRSAGALFYIYYFGEQMGIFKLVDVLVLNWSAGYIDVVDGAGADKLYRYWKMRDERISQEERGMVYKRVLNLGEAKVLSRMTVNEHFHGLWQKLMSEVAEFIEKKENSKGTTYDYTPVSRKPLELASKALQYNLTEYATGMVHMHAREMYSQLQEAFELLRDEQILDHFGGKRRKNMWKAIEQIAKKEFGRSPNVGNIRTLAIEGYNVFQWLAQMNITDDVLFQNFLESSEAWIIAAGSEEGGLADEDVESDEEYDEFEEDDEFEEFEEEDEFSPAN